MSRDERIGHNPVVVGLGETLWDVFPDGPRLGGAPLNFSCSSAELAQSAAQVFMVSCIGDDELGRQALDSIAAHGVDVHCMQTVDRPTGQVLIELDSERAARYRFAEDSAWDHLAWNDSLRRLAADCSAVCFGTLGQRSERSRNTIETFVKETPEPTLRILDVNLRDPFFNDDVIVQSLALANILKLNDEELPLLARLCGASGSDTEIMRQLAERFQFRCVALTRGADGAILVQGDDVSDLPGIQVDVVDTVGAGDAFTAALTLGLLAGRDIEEVNRHAITVASYVCSRPGATMSFPADLFETGLGSTDRSNG